MGIFDIFSTKDQEQAAQDTINSLHDANREGQGFLNQGLDLATGSYTAGVKPFLQNLQVAQGGQNAYADATGANGSDGNARAIANFQSNPGYQYALDQATQNVMRNRAASGQLGAGGTDVDLAKVTTGLANQNWNQYVQNLLPFLNQSTANAGGVLAGESGLGNLQNANRTNVANMAYGTNVGIGNANASKDLAGLNQSANILGGIMNLGKTVAAFV